MTSNETVLIEAGQTPELPDGFYTRSLGDAAMTGTEVERADEAEGYGLVVEPIVEDYARAPLAEAFDWQSILEQAEAVRRPLNGKYYLVAFRSQLAEHADVEQLTRLDAEAHAAALESPALLRYFADEPNAAGEAVSFCLWSDREAARTASSDPRHLAAMQMVEMYEDYSFERHYVKLTENGVEFSTL